MMDDYLILKSDAEKVICDWCGICPEEKRNVEGCDDICPQFAKIQPQPKWIPTSEKLPEDGKFVLVCNDDEKMMVAKWESEVWRWEYLYCAYDWDVWEDKEQGPIKAWMPLPEPYKAERREL